MKKFFSIILYCIGGVFFYIPPAAQADIVLQFPRGSLEEALFEDTRDGRLNRVGLEQAILIASEIDQDHLPLYVQKIDSLYNQIALRYPMKKFSPFQKGQTILKFLHQTVLRHYDASATEIQTALDTGKYNCVSATLLFNILCSRFGVRTAGVEVPTHLYAILFDPALKNGSVEVQTTSPQGFFIKGFFRNEFIYDSAIQTWQGKRTITDVELIGVVYYNRGIYWIKQKAFGRALPFYQKALTLDPRFPQLDLLVADLYTAWGNVFFQNQKFEQSAQIYLNGIYFLSQDKKFSIPKALKENYVSSLINQASLDIKQKKWDQAQERLKKAFKSGLFREKIINNSKALYYYWAQDYIERKNWEKALSIYRKARDEFPQEKGFEKNMIWIYAKAGEDLLREHELKKARIWFDQGYQETQEPHFKKASDWLRESGF